MKECTNCKCQVGSGIVICPYCSTYLPEPVRRESVRPRNNSAVVLSNLPREAHRTDFYPTPRRNFDHLQAIGGRFTPGLAISAKPQIKTTMLFFLVAAFLATANLIEIVALLLLVL